MSKVLISLISNKETHFKVDKVIQGEDFKIPQIKEDPSN
jgi:hypothetical protein